MELLEKCWEQLLQGLEQGKIVIDIFINTIIDIFQENIILGLTITSIIWLPLLTIIIEIIKNFIIRRKVNL